MNLLILEEHGYSAALLGLCLSYNQNPDRMPEVAKKLCFKGDGHNKFLESIVVWIDMDAPRYFWLQFDTYRVGVSKQSESTMHTMTSRPLQQTDFEYPIPEAHLQHLNALIAEGQWQAAKRDLPESFLQRRIVCLNYMVLQRMIRQRESHRLAEWRAFVNGVLRQAEHSELLHEGASE
ncbi:hypothetical protein KKG90_11635 [Candidatus Bipolaricaulota bacterium]|nr:hypothetical protein [Candidatus Bipolaricaulota bacterium]